MATTILAPLACAAWLAARSPTYTATSQLLIKPLPATDRTFLGVEFIQDSGDPTRTAQTAASIVDSPEAAAFAARRLHSDWTPARMRSATSVTPEGQSNNIDIEATAARAEDAARVANAYAAAVLTARAQLLRPQIRAAIERTKARLRTLDPGSPAAADLIDNLNQLESVKDGRDPTLVRLGSAAVPASANGPSDSLLLVLAALAGLTLGATAAILLELLDPRLRDEEEAVDLYPLPVLARIPPHRPRALPRRTGPMQAAVLPEGFRTLHVQLTQNAAAGQAIMITSASAGDGKTTTALNLARTIAAAGQRVVILDLDMRRGGIATALGLAPAPGLLTTLDSPGHLETVLQLLPDTPLIRVAATGAETPDPVRVEQLFSQLPQILDEAKTAGAFVIVDTAPLGEVSDALRVAGHVDDIVILVRPGHTRRAQFAVMRDLLDRAGYAPTGLVVIGSSAKLPSSSYYYGVSGRGADEQASRTRRIGIAGR